MTNTDKNLPISSSSGASASDSGSSKSTSSMFVEGLAPINPRHWASFGAGSAMGSDMPELGDKVRTPFSNLVVAKEYLETSASDIQYKDRFWQVVEDTAKINLACELGDDVGSFTAGAMSNQIADGYVDEMAETAVTLNKQEELNLEIYKQTGREQNMDVEKIRGTGLAREYVPNDMQSDLCSRPERGARPADWDTDTWSDDGICFEYDSPKNPKTPSNNGGNELDLPSSASNIDSSVLDGSDIDNNNSTSGGIFGKISRFFWGGDDSYGSGSCGESSGSFECSESNDYKSMSFEEEERLRDQAEQVAANGGFCDWLFGDWGGSGSADFDPTSPMYNPPMFLDTLPPNDCT